MGCMNRVYAAALALAVLTVAAWTVSPVHAETKLYSGKPAKYVFFFIGDGMGLPQKAATEAFAGERLLFDTFPAQGITTTTAADRFITGSAAAATAMASGVMTNIGMIGMDPSENQVKSVAELAKEKGMKVGIVSSVSIDHATPAAFYANVPKRSMYHEIDHALPESGFDFFGGGGLRDPKGERVLRNDPNATILGDAMLKIEEAGYKIVTKKDEFLKLSPTDGKVLAYNEWLQDGGALPYALDMRPQDITLSEFTAKAIEMLDNDDKGFFLMVEGGKIDWACHANDAASAITNTLAFNEAVQKAMDFAKEHPEDTLILVTGDHECGGLTLGFAGTKYETYFDLIGHQKISYVQFDKAVMKEFEGDWEAMKPIITENFGLKFEGDPEADRLVLTDYEKGKLQKAFEQSMIGKKERAKDPGTYRLYGGYNPITVAITHAISHKAGLGWTSFKHTGVPVATSAMGVGADSFNGYYANTDVAKKLMAIIGVDPKVYTAAN